MILVAAPANDTYRGWENHLLEVLGAIQPHTGHNRTSNTGHYDGQSNVAHVHLFTL